MVVWEGETQKGGHGGGTLAPAPPSMAPPPLATASPPLRVVSGAAVLAHLPRGPLAAGLGAWAALVATGRARVMVVDVTAGRSSPRPRAHDNAARQLQSARSAESCYINRP